MSRHAKAVIIRICVLAHQSLIQSARLTTPIASNTVEVAYGHDLRIRAVGEAQLPDPYFVILLRIK